MNPLIEQFIDQTQPKFNPDIVNGLACIYVPYAMESLDVILKSAAKSFPKGFEYSGISRCTTHEEYYYTTKARSNKRVFELARSSLYLTKIKFFFTDHLGVRHEIPDQYLYLPFVEEAGIFYLGGTQFHITGVLSDKVISPSHDTVFVRLIRDRMNFKRRGYTILVDGRKMSTGLIWSSIYRRKESKDKSNSNSRKIYTSIPHYLFSYFGVEETFKRYCQFTPIIGHGTPPKTTGDEIIVRSAYYDSGFKPPTTTVDNYTPSDLYLIIPKEHWTPMTKVLVTGLIYCADLNPDRVTLRNMNDTYIWSVMLGHIIFSNSYTDAKTYEKIKQHFNSLNDYLDIIVIDKLKEIGWDVDDFYDFIAKIAEEFPKLITDYKTDQTTAYDQSIEILYYLLSDISIKLFNVIYTLRKHAERKHLTVANITKTLNTLLTTKTIHRIKQRVAICEPVSTSGDHKYLKITSKLSDQNTGNSNKSNTLEHIKPSDIECGSLLFLPKGTPKVISRLNPYADYDRIKRCIVPKEKFKQVMSDLERDLRTVTEVHRYSEELTPESDDILKLEDDASPNGVSDDSHLDIFEEDGEEVFEIDED